MNIYSSKVHIGVNLMKNMLEAVQSWFGASQPNPKYLFNDPTTPELFIPITIPPMFASAPDFTVVGWNGAINNVPGNAQFQAMQVYVTIVRTLNNVQTLRKEGFLKKWAGTNNLVAIPRAGQQLNAYYDRVSLRFFHGTANNKIVYAAESVDVVAHELGHAILDSLRPELWNGATLEVFAFHESFGDIIAVSTLLASQDVRKYILKETAGDLMQPNIASRIAEEMGNAIFRLSGGQSANIAYLRSSINPYKYAPPETLPERTSDGNLAREPHSFSRIFTGAWYDCLSELYKVNLAAGIVADLAVLYAMRDLLLVTLEAVIVAPFNARFFNSVATSMVNVTRQKNDQKLADIILKVMNNRNILSSTSLFGTKLEVVKGINTAIIDPTTKGNQLRLNMSQSIEGANELIVDLPTYGIAGETGEVTAHCANECLSYIQSRNLIGTEYDNKMFSVLDGKLSRNFICNAFRR